jgi:hypothetical protein
MVQGGVPKPAPGVINGDPIKEVHAHEATRGIRTSVRT